VVIAIIGLLAASAVPAFQSISQSRGIGDAAYQVAAAVELARSEAISRQTYVWMGLQPVTDSGGTSLFLGMVYSKDGSGTNTNPTNLQPLTKPIMLQRVGISDPSNLTNVTTSDVLQGLGSFSALSDGLPFSIGRMTNSNRSITFTPAGEVVTQAAPTSTTAFEPRIGVGLSQSRGTTLDLSNSVLVVIDGSVGSATIYRR